MAVMSRLVRLITALVVAVSFVFAQTASAAYACASVPDPVAVAQMMADMEDMPSDGGLCDKHCTTGTVSFDLAKPASTSMPAVAPVALRIVFVDAVHRALPARFPALSVAGPAPPLIRFTVLRI
jgi:hypothetical protein